MEFLKKHYEKILLSVVLLGLAAAAVWLPTAIGEAKSELNEQIRAVPTGKAIEPLNLAKEEAALEQLTNPPPVVLSGEHNLFNPVTWKRKYDGSLLKVLKEGPDALVVTAIQPLYTVVAYDRPANNGAGYYMAIQQHSMKKGTEYSKKDEKSKSGLYIIRGIKGAPEDPTDLQLEIPDTQEMVWVTKEKPYQRVDGYTVDMRYEPESLVLNKKHLNDTIALAGETYKIVYITNNAVRVSANSTTKQTTITWNGAP